eukprot:1178246-Amphidinium_carterae.1
MLHYHQAPVAATALRSMQCKRGAEASWTCQSSAIDLESVLSISCTPSCATLVRTMVAWMGTALKWWVNSDTTICLIGQSKT